VVVAFVVEQELGGRGLATVAATRGPFSETVLVDGGAGGLGAVRQSPDTGAGQPALGRVTRWSLGTRYAGSAVETVSLADADSLGAALGRWIGGAR
jgi:hypothetical protein